MLYSMPAIRYPYNGILIRADYVPSPYPAPVLCRSGSTLAVDWLGFLFEETLDLVGGLGLGYAKLLAHEVTQGNGLIGGQWYVTGRSYPRLACKSQGSSASMS